MKKKTAILLVGAFVFTAAFSGCGKNKEATEAANESVESERRCCSSPNHWQTMKV